MKGVSNGDILYIAFVRSSRLPTAEEEINVFVTAAMVGSFQSKCSNTEAASRMCPDFCNFAIAFPLRS